MSPNTIQFSTVLPHEPLPAKHPSSSSTSDSSSSNDVCGYVHLQGAFVPKRKESKLMDDDDRQQQQPTRQCCKCNDINYIQTTLESNIKSLIQLCGMTSSDILAVQLPLLLSEVESSSSSSNNTNKVRIQLTSPAAARTFTSRLKRGNYGPRDVLASSIITTKDGGHTITVVNEGMCPFECGGRYAGRPLQVTHVTPTMVVAKRSVDNDNIDEGTETDVPRWARATPPKFRRLIFNSNSNNKFKLTEEEIEIRRGVTRFVHIDNVLGGELSCEDLSIDHHNGHENDEDSSAGDGEMIMKLKNELIAIFQGQSVTSTGTTTTTNGTGGKNNVVNRNGFSRQDVRVEDDIRHAFQEALRTSLSPFDNSSSRTDNDNINGNNNNRQGIEVFLKEDNAAANKSKPNKKVLTTDTTKNSTGGDGGGGAAASMLYDHLHIGMRSNGDATRVIKSLQGKRLCLTMELPTSFLQRAAAAAAAKSSQTTLLPPKGTTISITTSKLFLDYADVVLLPNKNRGGTMLRNKKTEQKIPGEPSKSECTSATSHVRMSGLRVIPNYVSAEEEQILLAVLTGPQAPWAPPQYTPAGGCIKRRVQHYGYVFDYESSDVLRRDDGGEDDNGGRGSEKAACPPMPCMDSNSNVADMTNEEVEEWTDSSVKDVKGWDALAGVIEKTRRFDFSDETVEERAEPKDTLDKESRSKEVSLDNSGPSQTYPNLNQLTLNEYTPGQGIGSHVDTLTAFDDGLLIITLNGGIVMEFRKAASSSANDDADVENARKLVYLPPRSLTLLSGDARYEYEHMIVSRMTDTVDGKIVPRKLRVSLTLRTALTAPTTNAMPSTGVKISLWQSGPKAPPLPIYESKVFPPRWGQLSDAAAMRNGNESGSSEIASSTERSDLITPATESKHVHAVYDAIATQWHHTRGKRGVLWPGATQFLESLKTGSLVADVGCGDGKYFAAILAHNCYMIGTDISEPLLKTAAVSGDDTEGNKKGVDGPQYQQLSQEKRALSAHPAVAVADCIHLPLRSDSCDAAICIAVMHHLSTEGRRIRCLSELKRIVKVGGLINVQAWALEQESDSKRKFHGTDVLVPFNAQPKYLQTLAKKEGENDNSSQSMSPASTESEGKGVAQMMAEQYNGAEFDSKKNLVVFQRYCHMYRHGELESLVEQVPGLEVLESTYQKGNHVVSLRVVR